MTFKNLDHRRSAPSGTAGLTYNVPALNEAPVLAGVWWSGGIAPRILTSVISVTPLPVRPKGMSHRHPWGRGDGWPPNLSRVDMLAAGPFS